MSVSDALNDNADLMSRLSNITTEEQNVTENFTKKKVVYSLSNSCLVWMCVSVRAHTCIYAYVNFQLLLWCQPMLSSVAEMGKEMLAPDSQSVLFLGRTYNYSNECIQKHHMS